jgi:hypothetical protein
MIKGSEIVKGADVLEIFADFEEFIVHFSVEMGRSV